MPFMPHTRGRRAASSITRRQRPVIVAADDDEAVGTAERGRPPTAIRP